MSYKLHKTRKNLVTVERKPAPLNTINKNCGPPPSCIMQPGSAAACRVTYKEVISS